jgi:hypothetical protein
MDVLTLGCLAWNIETVLCHVSYVEEPQVGVEVKISGSRKLVLEKGW